MHDTEHLDDPANWQPVPAQPLPWDTPAGCKDWPDWDRAHQDGAKLYLGPDIPEVREHNQAERQRWQARQDVKRRENLKLSKGIPHSRKRNYALGTLQSIADELAGLQPNTSRDKDTADGLWRLAGFYNEDLLTREEIEDAILKASETNGHFRDNKSVERILKDIETALDKATHGVDWSRVGWKTAESARAKSADGESGGETMQSDWQRRVRTRVDELRLQDEARRAYAAQQRRTPSPPVTLTTFLAQPDDAPQYRIERLLPTGGRALLSAQYKAGKTAMRDNLIRSLVDGKPFLGEFDVSPARVVLIDDEVDERQMRRWLRSQGIDNPDNVRVKALRGEVSTFDILDTDCRAWWAEQLGGAHVLVIDCLRPILDALGLSEDKDAGQFLVALDALLKEAGISEAIVVHHMGHVGERSRGDSRLLDWPDVNWRIVKDKEADDPDNPDVDRYFSAYGRDVDVREALLDYTPETRSLVYVSGRGRGDSKVIGLLPHLVGLLRREPGLAKSAVEAHPALTTLATRKVIRQTISHAIENVVVYVEQEGRNHADHLHVNPSCDL